MFTHGVRIHHYDVYTYTQTMYERYAYSTYGWNGRVFIRCVVACVNTYTRVCHVGGRGRWSVGGRKRKRNNDNGDLTAATVAESQQREERGERHGRSEQTVGGGGGRRAVGGLPEDAVWVLGRVRRPVHQRPFLSRARVLVQRAHLGQFRPVQNSGVPVGRRSSVRQQVLRRRRADPRLLVVAAAVLRRVAPMTHSEVGQTVVVVVGRVVHRTLRVRHFAVHLFAGSLRGQSVHPQQTAVAIERVACGQKTRARCSLYNHYIWCALTN